MCETFTCATEIAKFWSLHYLYLQNGRRLTKLLPNEVWYCMGIACCLSHYQKVRWMENACYQFYIAKVQEEVTLERKVTCKLSPVLIHADVSMFYLCNWSTHKFLNYVWAYFWWIESSNSRASIQSCCVRSIEIQTTIMKAVRKMSKKLLILFYERALEH